MKFETLILNKTLVSPESVCCNGTRLKLARAKWQLGRESPGEDVAVLNILLLTM